jgi:hypothetical protein
MNAIRLREIPTYQHMSVCLCQLMDAVFFFWGGEDVGMGHGHLSLSKFTLYSMSER